jgi:hypothetical protein
MSEINENVEFTVPPDSPLQTDVTLNEVIDQPQETITTEGEVTEQPPTVEEEAPAPEEGETVEPGNGEGIIPEPEPVPPPPPSFVRPYINTQTGEIRNLDDLLIYQWQQANNPKADYWEPYTPPPPPEPEPVANWEQFEDLALDSDSLRELFPRIGEISPVALTMLGAALLKAKSGDTTDFLRVWKRILQDLANGGIPVPQETLEGFVNVAIACHLPEAFVFALQGLVPPTPVIEPIAPIDTDSATFGEGIVEEEVDTDSATFGEGEETFSSPAEFTPDTSQPLQ